MAAQARKWHRVYVATFNAARFNPVIRTFYERLVARGKPKKVARRAAARKLLQIAWAVVITKTDASGLPQYLNRVRWVECRASGLAHGPRLSHG